MPSFLDQLIHPTHDPIYDWLTGSTGTTVEQVGPPKDPPPTPDYVDQYLQYFDTSGYDPAQIKAWLSSPYGPKGYNPNDPNSVAKAIGGLGLPPKFSAGGAAGGNDPLAMQAMFNTTIKPFMDKLAQQSQQNVTDYQQNIGALDKLNPLQGPGAGTLSNLFGGLEAQETAGLKQSANLAAQQALAGPSVTSALDALRAQYINQLNNLTTGGTTTTPAHITAPTTATKIASAVNKPIK